MKRLVVREINIVLSGAISKCERGRCQPNVVEIIALVTEARGRLPLLISFAKQLKSNAFVSAVRTTLLSNIRSGSCTNILTPVINSKL